MDVEQAIRLSAETIEGTALSLEGIDYVHGGYSLPLGVLGVGYSITDDVFQEYLEYTTSLLVNET